MHNSDPLWILIPFSLISIAFGAWIAAVMAWIYYFIWLADNTPARRKEKARKQCEALLGNMDPKKKEEELRRWGY